MLTYATSRGVVPTDRCFVDHILEALAKDDFRIQTLVTEIVKSDPFQKRRGGDQP